MILLNHVIQVLVGPDERLSGQDAFCLQFGDGLMGRLTAVERDLLRDLMIADRFLEEAYGGRLSKRGSLNRLVETQAVKADPGMDSNRLFGSFLEIAYARAEGSLIYKSFPV